MGEKGDGSENRPFSVHLNGKMEMSPQKHFLTPNMYRTEIFEVLPVLPKSYL